MPDDTTKDDFLGTARKRFDLAAEDEKDLRLKFIDDLRFASPDGDQQWDAQVKLQREQAGRPAMAFPRCHTFVQQVSNEARQNKPQIKFSPRLDSDKDLAEVYEGLARYIQYSSDAQIAYETAVEYSAGASFGYYRFITDYVDEDSDDQELKVLPVYDPLQVYGVLVPACFGRKPLYAFVVEDMPKEEFKREYPDSQAVSLGWETASKHAPGWVADETIRVAEYWYVEEEKVEGKRRKKRTVKVCKTNGVEILPDSETEWVGSTIPIIPVLGKQMIQEGRPRLFSVVRPQKAAQQMLNYTKTRIAETLSIAPVSPFMAAEGQLEGHEAAWMSMNKVLTPVLFYKPTDVNGQMVPAPQRQVYEPPIGALSQFSAQEVDDMKATSGIFDASLGSKSNETSGKAIQSRQMQSELSTMHYLDNLERSFRKAGDVIAEVIPKIYDTAREIQILGEDEAPKVIAINQPTTHNGKNVHYKMADAKFDIVVTMGRAYSTKRMESFDMMQQIVQSAPQMLPMFGDILFKNSDMAGADIVADRFEKMLPPNLQKQPEGAPQIPPELQAQMQQMQQAHQALNAHAQQLEKAVGQLQFEKTAEIVKSQNRINEIHAKAQADMALEDKKLLTQITVAEISTKAQIATERQGALNDLEAQFHEQSHEVGMAAIEHQHAQDLAAQNAAHQQDAQAQAAEQQAQPDQSEG